MMVRHIIILPPAKFIDANTQLADRIANAIRARGKEPTLGTTWTTDAPYRETLDEVKQYQSEGVKTVEMESAGLIHHRSGAWRTNCVRCYRHGQPCDVSLASS